MQMPKFYLRDADTMMVEWRCPLCCGPVNQPIEKADYELFFEMYTHFHPLETLCPECLVKIAQQPFTNLLRAPRNFLS